MGVSKESRRSAGNFFKIKHGGISRESKTPMPEEQGWVKREIEKPNTDPKEYVTKWLDIYPSLTGRIVGLQWYDTGDKYKIQYTGIRIKIRDFDTNEVFYLDLPSSSRHFNTFLKLMENIDYEKDIALDTVEKFDEAAGKKKTSFFVSQGPGAIKWKYTKNNMGDCPPPTKTRAGKWDFSEQTDWLLERFDEIVDKVSKLYPDEKFDEVQPDDENDEPEYSGPPEEKTANAEEISGDDIKNLRKKSRTASASKGTDEKHWTEELKDEEKK